MTDYPARLPIGTRVEHETHGKGEVLSPTGHTHRNYTHVFFKDEPKGGGKVGFGVRRRVRTDFLKVLS